MQRRVKMPFRTLFRLLHLEDRCAPGELLFSLSMPGQGAAGTWGLGEAELEDLGWASDRPLRGTALLRSVSTAAATLDRFLEPENEAPNLRKPVMLAGTPGMPGTAQAADAAGEAAWKAGLGAPVAARGSEVAKLLANLGTAAGPGATVITVTAGPAAAAALPGPVAAAGVLQAPSETPQLEVGTPRATAYTPPLAADAPGFAAITPRVSVAAPKAPMGEQAVFTGKLPTRDLRAAVPEAASIGPNTAHSACRGDSGSDPSSDAAPPADGGITTAGRPQAPERFGYHTGEKFVGLNERSDRIAVELAAPSDDAVAALTARGGAYEGLRLQRWLSERAVVLEGPGAAGLLGQPLPAGVTAAVPVFINRWDGRDTVVFREVIVGLKPGVAAAEFFRDQPIESYRPLWGTPDQFVATLAGAAGTAAVRQANAWNADPRTTFSEPDFYADIQRQSYFPNDPRLLGGNLWNLWNIGQYGGVDGADVDMEKAWGINPGGSPNRIIAIVDDGVEITHPDLNPWINPNETPNGADSDGNGYADDLHGWNFVGNNNNASFTTNKDRHGTAVAGVAAAKGDNGIGVVGPSYKAQVMSVRIFEDGKAASLSGITSALYYASGRNKSGIGQFASVDVMNNSWAGGGYSSAIVEAFNYAATFGRGGLGTVVVAASANDFAATVAFPAMLSATNPGLISVGGSNNKDTRANYANFGAGLDLVAPTADTRGGYLWIDTTDRVGVPGYNDTDYTGIGFLSFGGTSASAPLVSGIAALVLSQAEQKGVPLTARQVKDLLKNSTDLLAIADFNPPTYDPETGNSIEFGRGRINAFTAVRGVGRAELSVLSMTAQLSNGGSYTLGSAPVGGSSTHTLRIRNTGTSPLVLGAPQITAGAAHFAIDAPFAKSTLLLGESTTLTLRFAPTGVGAATGVLSFTSNDSGSSPFVLNLSGTGVAGQIAGTVFEDWNGNGVRDPHDPGLPGRTLFLDSNNNGTLDRATFTNSSTALIPDKSIAGLLSTIEVTGQTAPVSGLTVGVNITHPYIGDLAISLIAPSGKRMLLMSGVGESSANMTGTTFSDQAAFSIAKGIGPFTGSFQPQFTPLSYFDGEDPNGTWSLLVQDYYADDIGHLNGWTLSFNAERTARTDSQGRYAFAGLPNGTHTVRAVGPDGWTSTGPVSHTVTIAGPGDSFSGLNFGSAKNNRAYLRVFDDQNANGMLDPGEAGMPGRLLFHDVNANGSRDLAPPPALFSKTANLAIPDNNTAGINSFLVVSGLSGTISDLEITVNAAHAAVGDLRFRIISPSGANILLVDQRGSNGVNFTGTTFSDAALIPAKNMLNFQAPFTHHYQPEAPLAPAFGSNPNGLWILQAFDLKSGTSGTLLDWSVRITTKLSEPAMTSGAHGNAWLDLPAGMQQVRLEPLTGWKFTNPADGKLTLTAAGAPIHEQLYGTAEAVPPSVQLPIIVNDGAAQRSQVTSVRVKFSELVQFDGPAAGAFQLTGPNGSVPLTAKVAEVGGKTEVTLQFSPVFLPDGKYTLTVNAAKITDLAQNQLTAPPPQHFHRFYGDGNGDGMVDSLDFALFGSTFGQSFGDPNYLGFMDSNQDDAIDSLDFAEFGARFGQSI